MDVQDLVAAEAATKFAESAAAVGRAEAARALGIFDGSSAPHVGHRAGASTVEVVGWVKRCPNPMPEPSEVEIRPLNEMAAVRDQTFATGYPKANRCDLMRSTRLPRGVRRCAQ